LIELHFHCLPGIDDGPSDWEEAVALCRAAAADGTTRIVATPHVLRDPWRNEDAGERDALVSRLNHLLGGEPAVLSGCEYRLTSDALELWERGSAGPLTGLNRSPFLLVELPAEIRPRRVEAVLHEFSLLGVTVVLAHPERHPGLAEDLEWAGSLVSRGAVLQVTAGSVMGEFGSRPMASCERMFERGLVGLVASDAHSLRARPPRLSAARDRIRRSWGREVERAVFEENPRAVLDGRTPPWP
jgi:protein-tyrosine phosphatase